METKINTFVMKNTFFLFVFSLIALLTACSQKENKNNSGYVIEGSLPENVKGKIYLLSYKNREYVAVDSTEITKGKFKFVGKLNEPLVHSLRLNNIGKRANFFLENAPIKLTISKDWEVESIKGTQNTERFKTYDKLNSLKALNLDSILKTDNASPVIAYFLGRNAYLYNYPELVSLRKQVSDSLLENTYLKELDNAIAELKKVQPGAYAPDISMENAKGETFKLSDLKGKYVLIDFWATWCPDCLKEIPNLKEIYNKYKQKNFTILGVSLDRNKQHWKDAISDGLSWEHGFVEGAWKSDVAKTYTLRWLPTYILIDTNGIIVARTIDSQKIVPEIEKLVH